MTVFHEVGKVREVETISIKDALHRAHGRSIVVGEHHTDREARGAMLGLMDAAHQQRYRTLMVEVSLGGTGQHWGLADEISYLEKCGDDYLPELDPRSYIEPDHFWQKWFWWRKQYALRVNRHWMIQQALLFKWNIIPIDPCHFHWERGGDEGYFGTREDEMVNAVRTVLHDHIDDHRALINVGLLHSEPIQTRLLHDVFSVVGMSVESIPVHKDAKWNARIQFAGQLPLLVA